MGYACFHTGKYQQALPLFLQYAKATKSSNNWHADALVRAADCYYITKAYTQALDLYNKTQADYPAHASYQKALIYEIMHKPAEAKQNLETIIKTYAHTVYYEKALLEYAYLALQGQDYKEAVSNFTQLIQQKPYSPLIPDALLHRAIAYVNLQQYAEAGKDYEALLTDYPTHPNTQNALIELPKLVNLEGKPEKLQQYLDLYKAKNPSSDKLEAITLEAAKNLFYNQSYQQAIEQLRKFMANYPTSRSGDEAGFLLAEAYYRLGDDAQALQQYQQATGSKQSAFYNKILLRIAAISYKQQDFATALANYTELKDRATHKKESYLALEGMMKTNAALQRHEEVVEAAQLIIKLGNITVNAASQATLYMAKAAMQQAKYTEALQQFQQLASGEQDTYAAEAQYCIAQIHFQLGDYKQSLEALFVLTKQFTDYPIWVNQGFLLMADNYIALHETFQAKATLQSIIDHAKDATLVQQAQEKLQTLMQSQTDSTTQAGQEQAALTDSEFKTLEEEPTN
jgi:TolA-binding protein